MAHIVKLSALTDELITLITSFSPQNEPNSFNTYRESALRSLRYHSNARTNQFDVANQLEGLEEKFRVYNKEALADALRSRLDELAPRTTKWTPEILHLLLELSDKPVVKSKLSDLELLKPSDAEIEPKLKWEDLAADYDLKEKSIWKNIDYTAESSDDENASFEDFVSESEATQATELSMFEEPEGNLFENAIIPINNEGLEQLLKAQFWKSQAAKDQESLKASTCRITELQAVREILFMISGSSTSLFTTSENKDRLKPVQVFALDHASSNALQAVLSDLADQGSAILRLRIWIKKVESIPLIQSFQSAIEKRLKAFDTYVSDLQTTYVSPQADKVVSLLEMQTELNQAARPLLELSKILQELESEPYSQAFRYLELLYNKICMFDMTGEYELYEFTGTLFFECFSVYLRPLRRWMEEGEVKKDDKVFFIAENIHEVEPSLLWEEKYILRKTPNGSLHAPQFLHTSANKIFTTGKSVVVLKKLNRFDMARKSQTNAEPLLGFNTVCGFSSHTLTPFSELFDVAFERWIQSKHHTASSILRECLYHDCGLWTSLENLENLFFMKTPTTFPNTIFEKLDHLKPSWTDRFTLTELARSTIGSLPKFDSDRLTVSILPTKYNDVQRDRQTVTSLSSIIFTYRLPWAIQMILIPTTITIYQKIHTLLLQTFRSKSILSNLPLRTSLKNPTSTLFSTTTPTQSLHYSLRTRLLWFTNLLSTHLTTNILCPATTSLHHSLTTATDIDEMIAIYNSFARKIEEQTMLGGKLEVIHKTILKILDMAIRLADLERMVNNEPEVEVGGYRFIYGSGEVIGTPVKSNSNPLLFSPIRSSTPKKRRDSSSDSDSSTDSDTSTSERLKISNRDKSYMSDKGAVRSEKVTYYEQLRDLKAEFDGMVRFLREALRGVARVGGSGGGGQGGGGDGGREWDVFAEMIEEGLGLVV